MEFSFAGRSDSERFKWFAGGLRKAMERAGHTFLDDPDQAALVVNFFDSEHPRPFRRRGQAVFVTSVSEVTSPFDHPIPQGYPLLVRSLSNLFIGLHGKGEETPDAHFITPEQGYYVVAGNHDEAATSIGSTDASGRWPPPVWSSTTSSIPTWSRSCGRGMR
jgi:hypothetical protein